MQVVTELLATLCCAIFCGAALYINLVEHPARLECGTMVAATEFAPSYRRAALMQATLAACGLLFSVLAWLWGAGLPWLIGGILLGMVIPYTFIAIMPTNKQLLAPQLDKGAAE